ncbi:MAG: uL15 family ribosomal protein [Minisyncoccota bacterium]
MQLHQLKRNHPDKKPSRVGRGGKRGKTSGRGTKGQKARSGHKIRPEIRDRIKKMPKLRGHGKNRARTVVATRVSATTVNLRSIGRVFANGAQVTPELLASKDLVTKLSGRLPAVKIVGNAIDKKIYIAGCSVSAGARAAIEKAGGAIV